MKAFSAPAAVLVGVLALLPSGGPVGGEGGGGVSGSADDAGVRTRSHRVVIEQMRFQPARLTVASGDTVTWINRDFVPHTATAADRSWDSGTLEQGDRWSLVVENGGSIDYTCLFHPTMIGRLAREDRPETHGDER